MIFVGVIISVKVIKKDVPEKRKTMCIEKERLGISGMSKGSFHTVKPFF